MSQPASGYFRQVPIHGMPDYRKHGLPAYSPYPIHRPATTGHTWQNQSEVHPLHSRYITSGRIPKWWRLLSAPETTDVYSFLYGLPSSLLFHWSEPPLRHLPRQDNETGMNRYNPLFYLYWQKSYPIPGNGYSLSTPSPFLSNLGVREYTDWPVNPVLI